MKTDILLDYKINKENSTIEIVREYENSLELLWRAWTESELLEQWWAPKPWRAKTKTLDFEEGGVWHYAMLGPSGEKHWGKATYLEIIPQKSFTTSDGFCDESGELDPEFPETLWHCTFSPKEDKVRVKVTLTFSKTADLEKTIKMGFLEGFTSGLNQLGELLSSL